MTNRDKAKMYHAMVESLSAARIPASLELLRDVFHVKSYEVTLSVTVVAENQGQAIRQSIDDFHQSRTKVSVKDVKEV